METWEKVFGNKPPKECKKSWKAIEIANRVFGFNGWNSKILSMTVNKQKEDEEEGEGKTIVICHADIEVRALYGKKSFVSVQEGEGISEEEGSDPSIVSSIVRKSAVSDGVKSCLNVLFQMVCEWRNKDRFERARGFIPFNNKTSKGLALQTLDSIKNQLGKFD